MLLGSWSNKGRMWGRGSAGKLLAGAQLSSRATRSPHHPMAALGYSRIDCRTRTFHFLMSKRGRRYMDRRHLEPRSGMRDARDDTVIIV